MGKRLTTLLTMGLITGSLLFGNVKNLHAQSEKIDSCYKEMYKNFNVKNSIPNYLLADSKIAGKYLKEYEKFHEFALKNPAFIKFGNAIYTDNYQYKWKIGKDKSSEKGLSCFKMIPFEDKEKADSLAKELYLKFCKENKIDPKKAVNFSEEYPHFETANFDTTGNKVCDAWIGIAYAGDDLYTEKNLEENKEGKKFYVPKEVNAVHELTHLQRWNWKNFLGYKIGDNKTRATFESSTRIGDIINQDYIYKKMKNIPLDSLVIYSEKVPCEKRKGVEVGLIANTFRNLKKKYGTIEECLMSKEGKEFVKRYYRNSKLF